MNIVKDCELVKASVTDGKAEMKWYDAEGDQLLTVKFNKQSWDRDTGKFVDDDAKAAQCEEWAQKYLGCTFDDIPDAVGVVHDVYVYDRFCSLWEVEEKARPKKFTEPVKKIIQTTVEAVEIDNVGIHVMYRYKDELYESKYSTSEWVEKLRKFVPDPDKRARAEKRFKETFGVEAADAESIVGTPVQVQVKKAFTSYYGEILPV